MSLNPDPNAKNVDDSINDETQRATARSEISARVSAPTLLDRVLLLESQIAELETRVNELEKTTQ